jgi:hypothetical protein
VIRHAIVCLLAVALCGLSLVADEPKGGDDPPLLKKKKKDDEKPAPKKDAEPKEKVEPREKVKPKDDEPEPREKVRPRDDVPADPDADPKAVLERISKNIRESEDRLRKKDTGDGTQQVQRDIVKDMDSLIQRIKQQQQQQQDQNDSKDQQDPRNQNGQKNAKNGGSQQQQSASSQRQRRSKGDRQGTNSDPNNDSHKTQGNNGKDGGDGRGTAGGLDKKADIFKDIWGHLPEMMRQEMDAYSREQFAAKYSEMLKQYYQTIAEKGRRTEKKEP